jgi:hypothetical protein
LNESDVQGAGKTNQLVPPLWVGGSYAKKGQGSKKIGDVFLMVLLNSPLPSPGKNQKIIWADQSKKCGFSPPFFFSPSVVLLDFFITFLVVQGSSKTR